MARKTKAAARKAAPNTATVVSFDRQGEAIHINLSDGTRRPWNRRTDPPPPLEPTIEVDRRTGGAYQPLHKPASNEPYAEEGLGGMTDRQAAGL